jgi:uncharacterized protein (TIRG00374 family)
VGVPITTPSADSAPSRTLLDWLRGNALFLVGLVISGWAIWEIAKVVRGDDLLQHLTRANWLLVAACFLSVPPAMLLKVIRQRYLFGWRQVPSIPPLYSALYIGYLMNTVLPGRVGEFVRAFLIGRQEQIGIPTALSSIVLEKLLDLSTLALLLIVLILITPLPDWATPMAYTSAAAMAGGLAGLGLMLALRGRVVALITALEKHIAALQRLKLAALATSFLDGLAGLGRDGSLPRLILWSVLVWAASAGTVWAGLASVGVWSGLAAVLLTLVVTNIGMAVPSAPGYAGVFEGLVVLSLLPYGINESQALAAALILHATIFGNFILGGLWFLWRGGHSLRALRGASGH